MMLHPQRLTSPTVKVRRLGYLVATIGILANEHLPTLLLLKRLREWSQRNYPELRSYSSELPVRRRKRACTVGAITSEDAAKRYISTAKEMGLVFPVAREWQNTKTGNVVKAFGFHADKNPFELSSSNIYLLLKFILSTDYDYLSVIPRLVEDHAGKSEARRFQDSAQKRFLTKLKVAREPNLVEELRTAAREITRWSKPEEYFSENIKAPRLEWLIDLKIVTRWDQKSNRVRYRPDSEPFFAEGILEDSWFEEEYPAIFYNCYRDKIKRPVVEWATLNKMEKKEQLTSLLDESIENFRPIMGLDKISADQFFEYSICSLLTEHGILSSYRELEKELVSMPMVDSFPYRYVRMMSEVDRGYIVRK